MDFRLSELDRRLFNVRCSASGVHLFSRDTGVNLLLEELSVPSDLWSRAPRQVSVALTNLCDLHCEFCYAPKNSATLDYFTLLRWLNELDRNSCLGIGFGGGEPTLYPYLVELCRYATLKTKLAVTFTTHAHRISNSLAAQLKGYVHFVRVSMDGVRETYKYFRGRDFVALESRIDCIRNFAPFGINFVVNKATFADLDTAIAFASEKGAREFLLLPERQSAARAGIDSETLARLRDWVSGYQGTVPLSISEVDSGGFQTTSGTCEESGLRAYAHIDAAGFLKRSSYDEHGVRISAGGLMDSLKILEAREGDQG